MVMVVVVRQRDSVKWDLGRRMGKQDREQGGKGEKGEEKERESKSE